MEHADEGMIIEETPHECPMTVLDFRRPEPEEAFCANEQQEELVSTPAHTVNAVLQPKEPRLFLTTALRCLT